MGRHYVSLGQECRQIYLADEFAIQPGHLVFLTLPNTYLG